MGEVIRFPDEASQPRAGRSDDTASGSATVIILPVIRVDHDPNGSDGLEPGSGSGRRRRRRISR
jgi:hypothetical protein